MTTKEKIEHAGVVTKVTDKSLYVNMLVTSACSTCDARGACNVAESEIKQVEVRNHGNGMKAGDQVVVRLDQSQGILAILLGYVFPFILMLITLIVSLRVTGNEALSGLLAIGILLPYYLALYLSRNKLKQKFTFTLKNLN